MKFVIVGAGAVGAYIGARMVRAGIDVTLVARGPHLEAMRARGVRVVAAEGGFETRPEISASLDCIAGADVVILGMKAHGLTELAPRIAPHLGPDTIVVSTQNGLPWWFFQTAAGAAATLERVDPGAHIARAIELRRVVGSIVYFATEIVEPGVVRHIEGNRISLGEPDGSRSERCRMIAKAMTAAGLRAPVTAHLRNEIWLKIVGSAAFNPISLITGATLARITGDPAMLAVVRAIMDEAVAVAVRSGAEIPVSLERRLAGAAAVGEHKTSMLQDFEAGRPVELEAIVGAIVELADRYAIPIPHLRAVYACARMLAAPR